MYGIVERETMSSHVYSQRFDRLAGCSLQWWTTEFGGGYRLSMTLALRQNFGTCESVDSWLVPAGVWVDHVPLFYVCYCSIDLSVSILSVEGLFQPPLDHRLRQAVIRLLLTGVDLRPSHWSSKRAGLMDINCPRCMRWTLGHCFDWQGLTKIEKTYTVSRFPPP